MIKNLFIACAFALTPLNASTTQGNITLTDTYNQQTQQGQALIQITSSQTWNSFNPNETTQILYETASQKSFNVQAGTIYIDSYKQFVRKYNNSTDSYTPYSYTQLTIFTISANINGYFTMGYLHYDIGTQGQADVSITTYELINPTGTPQPMREQNLSEWLNQQRAFMLDSTFNNGEINAYTEEVGTNNIQISPARTRTIAVIADIAQPATTDESSGAISIALHSTIINYNINYTPIEAEVIDIPGLCFSILGMPFTFISSAFNLTLFPGTQYQLNVSQLFLTILGLMIIVFIIKMYLKSK